MTSDPSSLFGVRSMEQDEQQQRNDGENARVSNDSNVAQPHVAKDDTAEAGEEQARRW
jgi:hypothetical protein